MKAARALRWARRRAGLSQRALAERSGVPQSTIGRIEAGMVDPRVGTLRRLLRACGFDLEVEPALGEGIDRSQIRELLVLSPDQRLALAADGARVLETLRSSRPVARAAGG
jgi:transcriptional regulator with XRE-family HTH domain